ncbi:MAG: GNAT family N-acetyltransferase [Olegusella sp.]|nr:GNAT family N-acetyltransferase [Olegusella sp.]
MDIRKLTSWEDRLAADRVIATAFLDPWDPDGAEKHRRAERGEDVAGEAMWGLYGDGGALITAIDAHRQRLVFAGRELPATELHMVGSLPEGRGRGAVRALIHEVLEDARARGELFATLIPFSFGFYRKFGFELMARHLDQRLPIDQLAGFSCDYVVRQAAGPDDAAAMRALVDRASSRHALAMLSADEDWDWHDNGEVGERDFMHRDSPTYSYLFYRNATGAVPADAESTGESAADVVPAGAAPAACLKFSFVTTPDNPFVGTMAVSSLAYETPEALRNVLGFMYRFRAKVNEVVFEEFDGIDLALLAPEHDRVKRTVGGHWMLRVLDVAGVLAAARYPAGEGVFTIHVEDGFLTENDGTYAVTFADGAAQTVERTDADPDLTVPVTTFAQLAAGAISLREALYRPDTQLAGNAELLQRVYGEVR